MLGTASPWLDQSLVIFYVVFLVVGLPLIVSARLGFQNLVFGLNSCLMMNLVQFGTFIKIHVWYDIRLVRFSNLFGFNQIPN